jgi:hypothetical protein
VKDKHPKEDLDQNSLKRAGTDSQLLSAAINEGHKAGNK